MLPELEQLASNIVQKALDRGATGAECTIAEGDEFSVNVRMREIESLKEAGSKGVGLRVLVGQRTGSAYTSDLTADGVDRMVASAMDLAEITTEDPHAGLPDAGALGSIDTDLGMYSADVPTLEASWKIEQAKLAEEAALSFDERITNSEGAAFDSTLGRRAFANSLGFSGSYRSSSCSMSVVPVATEGESMERDYWFTLARGAARMEKAADIGRIAAQRALRRLNARKVDTQRVPVVFEPRVARTLIGHIFEAINGESVYRKASYLAGKLGETIAAPNVTIIDDATLPGLFGSSPFDDEGVPTRRTPVVEAGVLQNYLLNTYTARKLGLKTTGSASRGLTGNSTVGHGNFFLEPGDKTPEEIIGGVKRGLLVTELIGFGVNIVTGDYSRGAAGLWIENGEPAFPVHEVTIAGALPDMFAHIEAIGNDLEFRGSTAAPTLLIGEMTVSGGKQAQ